MLTKTERVKLKRCATEMIANLIQSSLEAGTLTTYQEQCGLSDEEREYMISCMRRERNTLYRRADPQKMDSFQG